MNETVHLFIIGTLATAVIGAYGWGWRLHTGLTKRVETEVGNVHSRVGREIQRLEQNFYEYKLHVANDFATLRHLRESEDRTQRSLSDISSKLDRLIEGRIGK